MSSVTQDKKKCCVKQEVRTLKHDTELLNFVYQNARMGIIGINQVRSSVSDMAFLDLLNAQYALYDDYVIKAEEALRTLGEKPTDVNPMAKAGTFVSTKTNTAIDSTTSHIAQMMIEGTTMGITKLTQKLNAMPDCSGEYKGLAQSLIDAEVRAIDDLKKFL